MDLERLVLLGLLSVDISISGSIVLLSGVSCRCLLVPIVQCIADACDAMADSLLIEKVHAEKVQ